MRLGVSLAGLATGNIALSFLANWYLVSALGPGRHTDALFAAMILPQLIMTVVATALTNVLVPLLAVQDQQRFASVSWTLVQAVLVATGLIGGALALSAPLWTPLTVPGFDAEAVRLTQRLAVIQLLGAVLTTVASVQRSAYNARHHFLWPEASALIANVASLGLLVWGLGPYGVAVAAWATVLRAGVQVVLLVRGMGRYEAPVWGMPDLAEAWRRARPLLLGSLYFKSDFVVDRLIASLAPPGALSLYSLAQQAYSSAQLILGKSIASPVVPGLARAAAAGAWDRFRWLNRRTLGRLLLLSLVVLAGILALGLPVLELTFGRGKFNPQQIHQLWLLLLALGGVWIGGVAGQIVAVSFYAQGDTRTPITIGAIAFTLAIPLKLGGFYVFGLLGLAVAASLYYLGSAGTQWLVLDRRLRQLAPHGTTVQA
ncbi:MAG: lipid II flippase MurJ [Gemmatimonadales bacterium]